jgi:hypothetical protein
LKIANQQGRYAVGHGLSPLGILSHFRHHLLTAEEYP